MARRDSIMHKPKDSRGAFLRLTRMLGPFRWMIAGVAVLCVVSNLLSLWGPRLAGEAIEAAAAGKGLVDLGLVSALAGRMLACYLTASLLSFVIHTLMVNISRRFAGQMRQRVFDKLMRLPVGFFDRNQAGDVISRVSYDIDVIATCMATDVVSILTSVVTVAGSLVMMLTISPLLSLVTLFSVPAAILYTSRMRKLTQPRFKARSKRYGEMNGFVEEMLSGQKTIQAYAYEGTAEERFDGVNTAAAEGYWEADRYGVTIGPTMGMINNVTLGLIALLGSVLYMQPVPMISLGDISSFVLYSRKFSGPINEIANIINELFSALAAAERVFGLLDEEEETPDRENAFVHDLVRGDVAMEDVSFGYEEGKRILHSLSLHAEPGKLFAIVGPTGAGKTTIINLLMRFYDVNEGRILLDGVDLRDATRRSVRGAWAMVLQDTWLFRGTIFDNIAYGRPNATMDEVVAAAKAAHIHAFIMRLPEGYQTVISEDGGNISKGQKQLLTIARAMLYDARMLILDEATSNVDTGTERRIQEAMRALMHDKTCFVIAHRLSTIRSADSILVLDRGDVVEQGTHETLMAKKGFYWKLYAAQFE
ncbi:MAG: ABC transporter ATP-binding protein [Clostridia bacterium]|nr:ABC transporter ATP-binding protein [Clostridia bacterium]